MTKPAAIFKACYSDWKLIRTRKCVQIILEVPLEGGLAHAAYAALGGMPDPAAETWVAVAHLDPETVKEVMPTDPRNVSNSRNTNDTQSREEVMPDTREQLPEQHNTSPASGPDIPARAHKKMWHEMELSQQAALLCKESRFYKFLNEKYYGGPRQIVFSEDDAAKTIRDECGVISRSKIIRGTPAGNRFEKLYRKFLIWRDADKYVEASA